MPDQTLNQTENTDILAQDQQFVDDTMTEETVKRPFYKSWKFILGLLTFFTLTVIGLVLILMTMYDTYKKADIYKESYDKVVEQSNFCREALTKEVKVEIVDYCREFTKRFENVNKVEEK